MENVATIVIPLLNQVEDWLDQSVRSALAQTVPCEVLVVTSHRTRRSNLELLERLAGIYSQLRIEIRPKDGFAVGLNHGIRSARCDRIAFLLSDDWLDPTAVEECLPHDADIVSTSQREHASDGRTRLADFAPVHTGKEFEGLPDLETKAAYLTHMYLFKRRTLLSIGGVDETLGDSPGVDDFDLLWVLLEHGARVAIVENRLYNVRDHEGERLTTRKVEDMTQTFLRILQKHGVPADRQEELLAEHLPWFGRSLQATACAISEQEQEPKA